MPTEVKIGETLVFGLSKHLVNSLSTVCHRLAPFFKVLHEVLIGLIHGKILLVKVLGVVTAPHSG
jgi:hypothetical protein